MKKKISLLLIVTLCLSVTPLTVWAVDTIDAPQNPKAALDNNVPERYLGFTDEIIISFGITDEHRAQLAADGAALVLQMDWSINSEEDWKCSGLDNWPDNLRPEYGKDVVTLTQYDIIGQINALRSNYNMPEENGYAHICYGVDDTGNGWIDLENNTIFFKLRFVMRDYDGNKTYSEWTDVFTIGKKVDEEKEFISSNWAKTFLQEADELGLIPECLEGQDMRKDIDRREFAAVCVKVYEALGNTIAIPAVNNPFTDTNDVEVLKAYNAGITAGTSDTTFTPDKLLNRQEAATMLTNTYKRVTIAGWEAGVDYNHLLDYEGFMAEKPFADHDLISGWARPSVYFMAKHGILSGMGDNKFGPRNVTSHEEATGYANATREQALTMAVQMVTNLGE